MARESLTASCLDGIVLLISLTLSASLLSAPAEGARQVDLPAKSSRLRELLQDGQAHLDAKRLPEARRDFEEAVRLAPKSALAHFRLARALNDSGDIEAALAHYKDALKLQPHIPATKYNIADCYQSLGRISEARSAFEQFIKEEPGSPLLKLAGARLNALKRVSMVEKLDESGSADYFAAVIKAAGRQIWPGKCLPLKVYISDGKNIDDFPLQFRSIAVQALDDWMAASNGHLSYELCKNKKDAAIVLDWSDDPLSLRQGASGAEDGHAHVQWLESNDASEAKELVHADIVILVRSMSDKKFFSAPEMKKILLHEIGHALGIAGHSANNHDVMFFGRAPTVGGALSDRDKRTIQKLYEGASSRTSGAEHEGEAAGKRDERDQH